MPQRPARFERSVAKYTGSAPSHVGMSLRTAFQRRPLREAETHDHSRTCTPPHRTSDRQWTALDRRDRPTPRRSRPHGARSIRPQDRWTSTLFLDLNTVIIGFKGRRHSTGSRGLAAAERRTGFRRRRRDGPVWTIEANAQATKLAACIGYCPVADGCRLSSTRRRSRLLRETYAKSPENSKR